jgi:hypothetical protein
MDPWELGLRRNRRSPQGRIGGVDVPAAATSLSGHTCTAGESAYDLAGAPRKDRMAILPSIPIRHPSARHAENRDTQRSLTSPISSITCASVLPDDLRT